MSRPHCPEPVNHHRRGRRCQSWGGRLLSLHRACVLSATRPLLALDAGPKAHWIGLAPVRPLRGSVPSSRRDPEQLQEPRSRCHCPLQRHCPQDTILNLLRAAGLTCVSIPSPPPAKHPLLPHSGCCLGSIPLLHFPPATGVASLLLGGRGRDCGLGEGPTSSPAAENGLSLGVALCRERHSHEVEPGLRGTPCLRT